MTESFTYDKLNRLETICTNGVYNKMQYDAHGRILSKETDGEYVFNNAQYETTDSHGLAKPHAISSASMNGNLLVEASNIHYIYKDHLGSWTTITDHEGNIEQEQSYDAWGNTRDPYTWTGQLFMKPMFDRGFTGHEYLFGFDLINMNGRMYDPVLSSFLSVDSYVQDPDNSQNFNRYAYCLNNPLKYTDPSGEVAVVDDIIAAAIVGAIINGFVQTASGNVQNFGQWCLATAIGGVAGAAGAWAGGAAALGTGFVGGAASGGIGGAVGGFANGAANAWMNEGSFGDGFLCGLSAAGSGALTGGLLGGVIGGINAATHHGNFWTGKGSVYLQTSSQPSSDKVSIGDGMEYSSKYVESFKQECYTTKAIETINKSVKHTYVDMSKIPKENGKNLFEVRGDLMIEIATGNNVEAACVYLGNWKSDVYLYKAAFTSKEMLYLTMSHEYIHAGFDFWQHHTVTKDAQHAVIYKWQSEQANVWDMVELGKRWEGHAESFEALYRKTNYKFIEKMGFNQWGKYRPWQ